jgi:hypothetical protein
MRIKIKVLFIILGFLICHIQVFSQKPNYSGTWKLNLQKSKFEANWTNGLTDGEFKIIQIGDKFDWSRYFIINGKKSTMKFDLIADGKVRRKKMFLFKCKLEWADETLKANVFRNGFSNVVDYKFGETKNELIIDEVFIGRPQDYHNHYVLDKVQ